MVGQKLAPFNPEACAARLKALQRLCDPVTSSSLGGYASHSKDAIADALLFVNGIDGTYNDGSRRIINWLFLGVSGHNLHDTNIGDDRLDDIAILITYDSVRVYADPAGLAVIRRALSLWRNLQLYCLDPETFEDDVDLGEEFKIFSFVHMLKDVYKIGIPLLDRSGSPCEVMAIEKWPLIQAYGLEGVGNKGFFSMNFDVVDIADAVSKTQSTLDSHYLRQLIDVDAPMLMHHWNSVAQMMDQSVQFKEGNAKEPVLPPPITEAALGEPLMSYFSYAQTHGDTGSRQAPRLIYGVRSSQEDAVATDELDIATTGMNSGLCHHFVLEADQPYSPLCASRTYFFRHHDAEAAEGKTADLQRLVDVYRLVVRTVTTVIDAIPETGSGAEVVIKQATETFNQFAKESDCLPKSFDFAKNVKVSVSAVDGANHVLSGSEADGVARVVKSLRVAVVFIPSAVRPSQTLGGVVYRDAFAENKIGGVTERSFNSVLNLTKLIPVSLFWDLSGSWYKLEKSLWPMVTPTTSPEDGVLGKLLANQLDHFPVLTPSQLLPLVTGTLRLFDKGISFSHPRIGSSKWTLGADIVSLATYVPESSSDPALLVLGLKTDKSPFSPLVEPQSGGENVQVALVFHPSRLSGRILLREVLPQWRTESEDHGIKISSLEAFPEAFAQGYERVSGEVSDRSAGLSRSLFGIGSVIADTPRDVTATTASGTKAERAFLNAYRLSDVYGHRAIPTSTAELVLGSRTASADTESRKGIPVHILSGVPGSATWAFVATIRRLSSEHAPWHVVELPLADRTAYSGDKLFSEFTAAITTALETPGRQHRILLVPSGYTDVVEVIRSLRDNSAFSESGYLASVVAVVNKSNVTMPGRPSQAHPKLLEQVARGFCTGVVVVSVADWEAPSYPAADAKALLAIANPRIQTVPATLKANGQVQMDVNNFAGLFEGTPFHDRARQKVRASTTPFWDTYEYDQFSIGALSIETSSLWIPLRGVLEKEDVTAMTAQLFPFEPETHLCKPAGLLSSVLGHIRLSSSPKKLTKVFASPRGTVIFTTDEPVTKSTHLGFLVHGEDLDQSVVGPAIFKCRPARLVKQTLRSRDSITNEERVAINKANLTKPLPSGTFFNGYKFLDFDGDSSEWHPDLEKFITEWIHETNQEIQKRNAAIDKENECDDLDD